MTNAESGYIPVSGGKLYYEAAGAGEPLVFVHGFTLDTRMWDDQWDVFASKYRVVRYDVRGFGRSDLPSGGYANYIDLDAVVQHLGLQRPHVVGLSMGGFATLHFGFRHPSRALSLVVAGCGYGAEKDQQAKFRAEVEVVAKALKEEGMAKFAEKYAYGPTRVQFENKDPRGFAQFKKELAEHSALGSANTQVGVQGQRPSLYDLLDQMRALTLPTLILTGDEDWPCLAPSVLMKREIPSSALAVMPNCGHTINIEDPDQFNRLVGDFIVQVEAGRWPKRDPRAVSASITGMR